MGFDPGLAAGIGTAFGTLAFVNPWILAGLLFLPLLWFLLQVTPPAPRLISFPAARFLADLIPEERTSSRTPWWILLLRILVLALIIIALARPVLNPAASLPGSGPVRLVMDNSWAAAQNWALQREEAAALASRAGRERREIYIMTTAPEPGRSSVRHEGPLTQGQAEALLRGLTPHPWPADYDAALNAVRESRAARRSASIHSYWLSHGLAEGSPRDLQRALQGQGSLHIIRPEASAYPLLLRPPRGSGRELRLRIDAPDGLAENVPVSVQALGQNGRILDVQQTIIDRRKLPHEVEMTIPETLRGQIAQFRLGGRSSAGAVVIVDDRFTSRTIGIAAPPGQAESAPLIEASFYLTRALEPYATLESGSVVELLEKQPAVIILPDIGTLVPEDLNRLEGWVNEGGLLLRFAGPNMTQQTENYLTPVPLRRGGRALDGALTWDEPVNLAPFLETSPFYGLPVTDELTVKQQILAEPVPGLDEKTWASLEDGTPLITAAPQGSGLLVMVHTTATAEWSDLALSGLYVQMLRRIVAMAGSQAAQTAPADGGRLQPLSVLDGFGAVQAPPATARPISSAAFDEALPGPDHPPGLYGRAGYQTALNLGDRLAMPQALPAPPAGVGQSLYGGGSERDLWPLILLAALILFLIDWVVMIAMQYNPRLAANRFKWGRMALAFITLTMTLIMPVGPAFANPADYAGDIHMAYIRTGDASIDRTAHSGLEALASTLARRTSVEPAGVVGLDPVQDELAFFPFIYWPVTPSQPALSDQALQNIQRYLDHGGTILLDTRDRVSAARQQPDGSASGGRNETALRRLIGGLDIPPLKHMQEDHVLTRSFYLMPRYPGRFDGGTIWVEEKSLTGRDDVSSVIIGSHDWAAAWGARESGLRLDGGARQQELALRFGVNVMMYALTGNYKADQVHVPHILERLGQ